MKKITLFLFVIILFSNAHQGHAYSDKKPMEKLLMDYIDKMNALTQGTKKEDVLSLFDEKYNGNTVYVNLSGALVRKNYFKKDISGQLDDIIDDDNYKFKLTLEKIVFQTQKERAGTISAVINFESYIDKKIAEKGTMLMDLVAIRVNGGWKIAQNNMIRVSEAKDIGECICYVYGKGTTKFVTEVYYPSGLEYSQELGAFQVTTKDTKRIIKSNSNEYYWNKGTGKIAFKGVQIGKAADSRKALEVVLKHQYKESCVNIVFN
ncbi:hypothetical protein D1816_19775 [Aquimarina sp. AD10]|uniref:SnoaL-like domain-containing protein n=1 Tax=Aquimarina aggregata TaxID=1642818 RepID=A0A162DIR4_9FLAO|nr:MULTISPECIES: hypothetical protein [Aquimarina]AXT62505.1 hypothetical protein D1816_19775 [Aquimarina sp. AD10]KZS41008.1 hypothetical protein AWE51_23945 [Aquimarina aggregata]RKM90303.1 hypothetical protein D7033_22635 [Aquimarina sp. AD10]